MQQTTRPHAISISLLMIGSLAMNDNSPAHEFLVDTHAQKNLHVRGLSRERSHPCCVGVTASHRHSVLSRALCTCVRRTCGNRREECHSSACGSLCRCDGVTPTRPALAPQYLLVGSILDYLISILKIKLATSSTRAESLSKLSNPRFVVV